MTNYLIQDKIQNKDNKLMKRLKIDKNSKRLKLQKSINKNRIETSDLIFLDKHWRLYVDKRTKQLKWLK
jgi:hypothetical protein